MQETVVRSCTSQDNTEVFIIQRMFHFRTHNKKSIVDPLIQTPQWNSEVHLENYNRAPSQDLLINSAHFPKVIVNSKHCGKAIFKSATRNWELCRKRVRQLSRKINTFTNYRPDNIFLFATHLFCCVTKTGYSKQEHPSQHQRWGLQSTTDRWAICQTKPRWWRECF